MVLSVVSGIDVNATLFIGSHWEERMQVSVTFRGMESTEALKAYTNDKLEHVKKVVLKPIEAHVILSVEKFRHRAEVTMVANGETLVADDESTDMYKSIDKVMDKLARQARRSKEKLKGRRRQGGSLKKQQMDSSDGELYDEDVEWDDSEADAS